MLNIEVGEGCNIAKNRDLIERISGCRVLPSEADGESVLVIDTQGLCEKQIADIRNILEERFGRVSGS